MDFSNYPANRGNLIVLKQKEKLYQKGANLLKKKLDGLIFELYQRLKRIKNLHLEMQKHLREGYSYLQKSLERRGILLAYLEPSNQFLEKEWKERNILGARVFDYEVLIRRIEDKEILDYDLEKAKEHMSKAVEIVIKIAKEEDAVRRILEEIKKTKRKKSFLEKTVLPAVRRRIKEIRQALDDSEREEIIRIQKLFSE